MSKTMLDFLNFQTIPHNGFSVMTLRQFQVEPAKSKLKKFLAGKTIIFHKMIQRLRKIYPEQMGSEVKEYYWNLIGDFDNRVFNLLVGISWEFFTLQEAYVRQNIATLNRNSGNIRFQGIIEDKWHDLSRR